MVVRCSCDWDCCSVSECTVSECIGIIHTRAELSLRLPTAYVRPYSSNEMGFRRPRNKFLSGRSNGSRSVEIRAAMSSSAPASAMRRRSLSCARSARTRRRRDVVRVAPISLESPSAFFHARRAGGRWRLAASGKGKRWAARRAR